MLFDILIDPNSPSDLRNWNFGIESERKVEVVRQTKPSLEYRSTVIECLRFEIQ